MLDLVSGVASLSRLRRRYKLVAGALLVVWSVLLVVQTLGNTSNDILQYVNPLIGSAGPGHVFAGATLPFGSVQVAWDSSTQHEAPAGYVSDDSPVFGISHLHHSGTGGARSMGQFQLFPFYSSLTLENGRNLPPSMENRATEKLADTVEASPGFFKLCLVNGICTRSSVTAHTAIHQITAPERPGDPLMLLFDPTSDLQGSFKGDQSLKIRKTDGGHQITSSGRWGPSFGVGSFEIFACLQIKDTPSEPAVFVNDTLVASWDQSEKVMLLVPLKNEAEIRVGISWRSTAEACDYIEEENPWEKTFNDILMDARTEWQTAITNKLSVSRKNVPKETLAIFWSSLYRTIMSPRNATGDVPNSNSRRPAFDDFYCIWDTYRTVHPLYNLLWPEAQSQIVQSLLDIQVQDGYLPDCRMGFCKGFMQGGSNADSLIADAHLKLNDEAGKIDWHSAFTAIRKDAEVAPPDWGLEGRGHISERQELGYIPANPYSVEYFPFSVFGRSASRTIEYSFNDFSIAVVANKLGMHDLHKEYLSASADWRNIWDESANQDGYSGFIQPRLTEGDFLNTSDLRRCSPALLKDDCYLMHRTRNISHFYESNSWEYSFVAALHDMRRVVDSMGGDARFLERLDHAWNSNYLDIGNEPAIIIPWLGNFAVGGYCRTVDRLYETRRKFTTSLDGLPGNDDQGSLAAFLVFVHFGFYPIASTTVYLFGVPLLPDFTIGNLRFVSKGFKPSTKQYITSARFNGRPYSYNWFPHRFFDSGGRFDFVLGESPTGFGEDRVDLPPSVSEKDGFTRLTT